MHVFAEALAWVTDFSLCGDMREWGTETSLESNGRALDTVLPASRVREGNTRCRRDWNKQYVLDLFLTILESVVQGFGGMFFSVCQE